jgi:hypothetical protein
MSFVQQGTCLDAEKPGNTGDNRPEALLRGQDGETKRYECFGMLRGMYLSCRRCTASGQCLYLGDNAFALAIFYKDRDVVPVVAISVV